MQLKILDRTFDRQIFNTLASHPLQSWEWGEAREKMRIEIIRIGEFERSRLKNVYQLSIHRIPYLNLKIGYLPRSQFPSRKALEFIREYGRKHDIIFVKIEPYEPKSKKIRYDDFFRKSPHPLFPDWTIMLNLDRSEKELFESLKSKTRYNIRLAQKKGVVVREMSNEKGFTIFSKLYFETCQRQNYKGHNLRYHSIVWEALKNKIAHILIAFYHNIPLAAYELFCFNDIFYYPYGGTSLLHRNLMASNILMWETIRFAKKLGAKTFDMWGSLPPNYNHQHPWAGFTRFKEGYGGSFVNMVGSYDLVVHPHLYFLYTILSGLRSAYLRFS